MLRLCLLYVLIGSHIISSVYLNNFLVCLRKKCSDICVVSHNTFVTKHLLASQQLQFVIIIVIKHGKKRTFIIIHSNRDVCKNSLKANEIFIIVALKLSQRNRFLNSQSCYVDQKRELASDSLCWYLIKNSHIFLLFSTEISTEAVIHNI